MTKQRDTSEVEPVDVIFQKIAQKAQPVPRSIERGERYQAMHDPAPASRRGVVEPPVVIDVTTDPGLRQHPQRAPGAATSDAPMNDIVLPVVLAAAIVMVGAAVIALVVR